MKDVGNYGENFKVQLQNRRRILLKCTEECDKFRFAPQYTTLYNIFTQIRDHTQYVCQVTMGGSIVLVSFILLFYFEGSRKVTQA